MDEYLIYVAVEKDTDNGIVSIQSDSCREAVKFIRGHCFAEGYWEDDYYIEERLCRTVSTSIVQGERG